MSESKNQHTQNIKESTNAEDSDSHSADSNQSSRKTPILRRESMRWWLKLIIQPILLLLFGAILIIALGISQRSGFFASGGNTDIDKVSDAGEEKRYVCPMLCTPPLSEPGRCPVCGMKLELMTSGHGESDFRSVRIGPAARRLANIQTVSVKSMPITRSLHAVGEIRYDEGTLKTISAYVDGRLDRLYADYTGVEVNKNDRLALVYSPRLYTGQVELLLAKKAYQDSRSSTLKRVVQSNRDLYESSKQRLTELGMTAQQIVDLEKTEKASSRMHLYAPISGTVIEKLSSEGQYVKEGQVIYKLADLSAVWLMLELFPEDAAMIRYGQKVEAEIQSLQGRIITGRVAFIDRDVDPKTRTVGVRVVIPNDEGTLRIGDYAKASISIPLEGFSKNSFEIYDPELANKWISPRHPHLVNDSAGECPLCGVSLVPAANFGFTDKPIDHNEVLVVPRNTVLMAGNDSVVYVETEPGRFEIRHVVLGVGIDDQIVIKDGLKEGELVATQGNFLIDSQMQLTGNPSLIDPTKAKPGTTENVPKEIIASLAKLSEEDRRLAEAQSVCPVSKIRLGAMGVPLKMDVEGTDVFICCKECQKKLLSEPKKFLAIIEAERKSRSSTENSIELDLPPIGVPQLIERDDSLPAIESLQQHDEDASASEVKPTEEVKEIVNPSKENL